MQPYLKVVHVAVDVSTLKHGKLFLYILPCALKESGFKNKNADFVPECRYTKMYATVISNLIGLLTNL